METQGRARNPRDIIDQLISRSVEKYGSYAYSAGFLGSMLSEIIETLPPPQKANALRTLENMK